MKRPAGIRLTQTEETKIKNQKLESRTKWCKKHWYQTDGMGPYWT